MGNLAKHALTNFSSYPEELLRRIKYWVPPVSPFEPIKAQPNSSLKIAVIVSDRLYQGLRYEGELFILTPDNWKLILEYVKPDILLVESSWKTVTRHWHLAQTVETEETKIIKEMLDFARALSIPSVYWNTQDHLYLDNYKMLSGLFDFVFCADPEVSENYSSSGINVDVLLPAVQPAIHNPIRDYNSIGALSIGVLYDGLTDLLRSECSEFELLRKLKPAGLNVIESKNKIFRNKCNELSEFASCILGCVTQDNRLLALKNSRSAITLASSCGTRTDQQWMSLETAACRVPIVHKGIIGNDVRKDIVCSINDEDEFLSEIYKLRDDELYRERAAQLAWRCVHENHTFSHRVRTICETIGVNHDWEEHPKVTVVAPTYREDYLDNIINTFDSQKYPEKDLVIAFNSNSEDLPDKYQAVSNERDDVSVRRVPRDMFAGACLNIGNFSASGDYCFRMDDDDYYGKNYLSDMLLHLKCIDAEVFGKPPGAISLENSKKIYKRRTEIPQLCVLPAKMCEKNELWLGGNTIGGKKSTLIDSSYLEEIYGTADTAFMITAASHDAVIVSFDTFNMVAMRREDQSTHTWKMSSENLLKDASLVAEGVDALMI